MNDIEMLTQEEQLLLMAAAVLGLGPDTNLVSANTARVVDQALRWLGFTAEDIRQGWQNPESYPVNEQVYKVLIRMTYVFGVGRKPERPGEALFEGSGNWGIPGNPNRPAAWPHFNSCRLTALGDRIATELLKQHPEYSKKS